MMLEVPEHLDPLIVDGSTGPVCTSTEHNATSLCIIPELNPRICWRVQATVSKQGHCGDRGV